MSKVYWGIDNVHYAVYDETTQEYSAPVKFPGAVSLGLSIEGEESTFYADNVKYFVQNSNNGYSADLEMATYTDKFKEDLLGFRIDSSGVLFEDADAQQKKFALLFQVKGDVAGKRFAYYNCIASRPSKTHSTQTESSEPETETSTLVISPIEIDNKLIVKSEIEPNETNAAIYQGWFADVYTGSSGE